MNNLEEYLIKEGMLEKFLNNVDSTRWRIYLSNAFIWRNIKEGEDVWRKMTLNSNNDLYITQDRIKELIIERIPRFKRGKYHE